MKNEKEYILIYGNCRKSMPHTKLLIKYKHVMNDYLHGFMLLDIKGIPVLVKGHKNNKTLVEIYECDSTLIRKMKRYYNHPHLNKIKELEMKDGSKAYVFYIDPTNSGTGLPVSSGDWVTYLKEKKLNDKKKKKKKKDEEELMEAQQKDEENKKNISQST